MSAKKLAIIIPAYNEATVIGDVIRSLPESYKGLKITIVVIDDHSSDDTYQVAKECGATVIRHLLNMHSGGATSTGFSYARLHDFDYTVTMDADGQHTSTDCLKIIDELIKDETDLVIGSRLINSTGMPWYRVLGNKGLSFITYVLFGLHVTDSQSGLKGLSKHALHSISIKSSGFEFCSEIIWRARQKRLSVKEIPIKAVYTDYSLAKGQTNWNAFHIIKNLIRRKVLEFIDV